MLLVLHQCVFNLQFGCFNDGILAYSWRNSWCTLLGDACIQVLGSHLPYFPHREALYFTVKMNGAEEPKVILGCQDGTCVSPVEDAGC